MITNNASVTAIGLGKVDAVIVNYNAGDLLAECVASALAEGVTRVIVVDNASHDNSLITLQSRQFGPRVEVLINKKNTGFSAGCNRGLRASRADKILFLNPDCVLVPGALAALQTALTAESDVGMVGGFLCYPDGSEQPGGRRVFPTPRRAFVRAFGLHKFQRFFPRLLSDFILADHPLPDAPAEVEAISGACMLVKREAVAQVGEWDEGYFLHCEDLDWCMRFVRAHWRILFVPDALVLHAQGTCSRGRPLFVEWHKHHGMLRFYRKFFRKQYPVVLWWTVVVGVWARFALLVGVHTPALIRSTLKRQPRIHIPQFPANTPDATQATSHVDTATTPVARPRV